MKIKFVITTALYSMLVCFLSNSFVFIRQDLNTLYVLIPIFLFLNIFAGTWIPRTKNKRLKVCYHGTILLYVFCISLVFSCFYQIRLAIRLIPGDFTTFLWSLLLCIGIHFVIFWNGIICVYLTSTQLGIWLRAIGIICGMLPVINVIVLFFIIKATTAECLLETKKEAINRQRQHLQLCATKYPILLVHGVFFRDTKFFNYWGRIPQELEVNGARIYYGNQPSAASIAECAAILRDRIDEILAETGAEKVNIIAHSKGGLDSRYAISLLGTADKVASLTTINTPHRGCQFADYLLNNIPADIQEKIATTYNNALQRLGEEDADFMAAVRNLTDTYCIELDAQMGVPEGVFCQSVGSVMYKSSGGRFPLNFSYHLVKYFSGENDGLVSEDSFHWGEKYTLVRVDNKKGLSHADIIDLNRANIKGFDAREFYVELVNDLKNRGF